MIIIAAFLVLEIFLGKGKIMKKIWTKALAYVLAVAMCLNAVNVSVYAQESNVTEVSTEEETTSEAVTEEAAVSDNDAEEATTDGDDGSTWDQVTTENVFEGENYRVTFTLTSYWETGYNANVKLENTGDSPIQNWYLGFDYNDSITNIWNAEVSSNEDKEYVIKNAGWNQDIAAGKSIEFGISGGHAFRGFPDNYKLIGVCTEVAETDYTILYRTDSDWGTGFTGSISVTNNTDTALEDWVLEFDFDREITEIWNGVIEEHEGNHYVVRNAEYNSTIAQGENVSIGIKGCEGESSDEPMNYVLYSYNSIVGYVVEFCVGAENVNNIPQKQIVKSGEYVEKPQNPVREGFYFIGWYVDDTFSKKFDFENTVINKDIKLYARWVDYLCDIDSDKDGIVDSLEEYFETDILKTDTDGDGLSDYDEVYRTGTNPLLIDTNNNEIDDANEDIDNDSIINIDEIKYETNPIYYDTDIDNLTDFEEIFNYGTNPTVKDTDSDGASDSWEIQNGYDPLVFNERFKLTASLGTISKANPVIASVNVEVYNAQVETLNIDKVKPHDNYYITPSIAGYIGDAYDFTIDGEFDIAELVFEYDVSVGQLGENFQPRIYYFNESTKSFEELENQQVEEGKVVATTTHFSTYILLNKVEFDKVWNDEIKVSANGENINIAFVVDLSGSMSGTKLSTTKTAINSFIDVLEEDDMAAIVSFTNSSTVRCNMTNNKDLLNNAVRYMNASGLTSIYKGIDKAISVFDMAETSGYKMMIVFTDGYDEPSTNYDTYYSNLVEKANEKDIIIYTIGISTIDEELLTKVAESTGGKYYYASVISELQGKVDEIKGDAIDYKTDTNNDGISDYHTKLIEEGTLIISNSSNELKGANLNYDDNGNITDDCDGDGLKNGEEIKVVEKNGKIYLEMVSHPLREYSDGDVWTDFEEVQNGTDPLRYEARKSDVDKLCKDGFYYYETTASDLRDDDFVSGLIGYSSIINGVWNKEELYRDLIIDYYSTYVTQDAIDDVEADEQKKMWYDTLVTFISNANKYVKLPYDSVYNINKLISYVNGVTDTSHLKGDFIKRVSELIVEWNKISEDATELRFDVAGLPYVKKYYDSEIVKDIVGSSQGLLDKCSDGISLAVYGTDVFDTITYLSQIEANKAVFNENIDALEVLSIWGTDGNIRGAANDVMDILAKEYLQVYASAISADLIESGADFALYKVASKVGYVAVVVAVRDIMNLLIGSKADVEQMYRILCYSDMCESYSKPLFWILTETDDKKYYYCYDQDKVKEVTRYMENIAQLRILGEQEYYKYIKNDGLLGFIGNYISGLDELKEEIESTILEVKERSDSLKLNLSTNIKYSVK